MVSYIKNYGERFVRSVASNPLDPSHRNTHMLQNFYRTKKEILKLVLPPPLEVPDDPQAYVFHCWTQPAFGESYSESAQFVRASYQGKEGWYLLANYVETDVALWIGRELFGLPKKIASIKVTREKNRIWGTTTRNGIQIMSTEMEITGEGPHDNLMESWSIKYSLSTNGALEYAKLISLPYRLVIKESYTGNGSVAYEESDIDPVQQIEVVKPLTCWYAVFDIYRGPTTEILEFKLDTLYPYMTARMIG